MLMFYTLQNKQKKLNTGSGPSEDTLPHNISGPIYAYMPFGRSHLISSCVLHSVITDCM